MPKITADSAARLPQAGDERHTPPMPLDTTAFLASTQHLSDAEVGAQALLLIAMWRSPECWLPDDDGLLARITKCSLKRWRQARRWLAELWDVRDGRWQPRYDFGEHVDWSLHPCRVIDRHWSHTRNLVLSRDGYRCAYCGDECGPFEIDHRNPRSRGGTNAYDNLTVACRPCNRAKGAMPLDRWLSLSEPRGNG